MNTEASTMPKRIGLANLHELRLDSYYEAILESAEKNSSGSAACRQRLLSEAHDLLALAQLSRRLVVHWVDLSADLRVKLELEVPVPVRLDPLGPVQVVQRALLGLRYPREAMLSAQAGYAFIRILAPHQVWHSNVSSDPNQVLCLGPKLPAGIPVKEIILMTFGALSLQTTQINAQDPAGVLNPAAADWWQRNPKMIPLTREPFLRDEVKNAF
jgi:hypothetical protein